MSPKRRASEERQGRARRECGRVGLVLLLALVIAGLGAWWLLRSAAESPDPVSNSRPAAAPVAVPAAPAVELPDPVERTDAIVAAEPSITPTVASAPEVPEPVPHVRRRASDLREYVDPAHFAERYAGATLAELRASKAEIEAAYFEAQQAAEQQLLDAGRAETKIRPRAKDLDAAMAEAKPHDSHGLIEGQRTQVLPNGELLTDSYAVPWEEFTPLYDKGDEMHWLGDEIRRREQDGRAKQASGK